MSCFEILSLQTSKWSQFKTVECNDLHSHLDLQEELFEKQIKSALEKIPDLEKQLHYFEQKQGDFRGYYMVENKQDNQTSMCWKKLTEVLNISTK